MLWREEMMLPAVPSLDVISERLLAIFPLGIENRGYVTREMAAKTIFTMLYAGAIEGRGAWVRPSQIYEMNNDQAAKLDDGSRESWIKSSLSGRAVKPASPWYAVGSREGIRDESIRYGLLSYRAVVEREGLPTTSAKPRYALNDEFAALFDPGLADHELDAAISGWQKRFLSKAAISRTKLVRSGAAIANDAVSVTLPGGGVRTLKPGPSSVIAKAVVEVFAPKFLKNPVVLWLSESGNKVAASDDALAKSLGLKIDQAKALPDIILVDLGADAAGVDMIVVFTEVVATDGPINTERMAALRKVAGTAGFEAHHLAFVTAFEDRSAPAFKKSFSELAWGSYAWCVTEPDHIIDLRDGVPKKLSQMS